MQGFGTIVTGTLVSGSIYKGQEIMFEPGGLGAKVRNIQVHGNQVSNVVAGQRTAINLSGLTVNDIKRGTTLVAPGYFRVGQILDLELTNLASEKRVIKQRQRIHFHLGTAEKIGRIHLLGQEELAPGETGFAQVILEGPILAVAGDRFVIRYYSPVITIGGGKVLGVSFVKKKRFKDKVLEEFRVRAEGSSRELLIRELQNPVPIRIIMDNTGLAKEQVEQELKSLREEALIVILQEDDLKVYWLREAAQRWGKLVSAEAARFQRRYPLRGGIGREELKKKLGMDLTLKTWQLLLDWGSENNFFRIVGNNVEALPEIKLPQNIEEQLECLHRQWKKAGLNPPDWQESTNDCGIALNKFQEFAAYFLTKGLWIRIGDYYFPSTVIEKAQADLVELLKKKGQVTVAEVRDYWQTSRKYALPLLEYFDSINLTKRDGVNRSLYK
jgi:selenocysteine-specific elongation factor